MLRIEREVVAAVSHLDPGDPGRASVEAYVAGALRAMPQHLRAGVAAESMLLAGAARFADAAARLGGHGPLGVVPGGADEHLEPDRSGRSRRPRIDGLAGLIDHLGASSISPLRQYARLFRSLVLFAEQEQASAAVS